MDLGAGVHIMGVCSGAKVLAATGLLDGYRPPLRFAVLTRLLAVIAGLLPSALLARRARRSRWHRRDAR